MKKTRLDAELVRQELATTTDEAKRLIMAGKILVDDQRIEKPGTLIKPDSVLRIKGKKQRYASRAGEKLEGALQHFPVALEGLTTLDLGASTGGFTDCLLQYGAKKVYAVDVGTNQLIWKLRQDPRVISLEKTHARMLNVSLVPEPIDFLVVDVSFTSLTYVLPPVFPLLAPNAKAICLFKPQFEAPRHQVGEGGLVDENTAAEALEKLTIWLDIKNIKNMGMIKSSVKGREGNQEYLIYIDLSGVDKEVESSD